MIAAEQVWAFRSKANTIARGFKIVGYDTEDLATEALLHLHKRVEQANASGEVIENFTHWATYIMKRKILDIRRGTLMNATNGKEEKLPWHLTADSINSHKPDGSEPAVSNMIAEEELQNLAFAVKQLHADDQQTYKHMMTGATNDVAAARCGCNLSAYQMRKSRVIKKLRALMVSLA